MLNIVYMYNILFRIFGIFKYDSLFKIISLAKEQES